MPDLKVLKTSLETKKKFKQHSVVEFLGRLLAETMSRESMAK